jgi:hypothetical protein
MITAETPARAGIPRPNSIERRAPP